MLISYNDLLSVYLLVDINWFIVLLLTTDDSSLFIDAPKQKS